MRSSHSVAAWLLERMSVDVALAGDLEECAAGRSFLWYWRQVLIALWVGTWSVMFHNKLLVLRAVATGCAVNFAWIFLWLKLLPFLRFPLRPSISFALIPYLLIILLAQMVTGWVVARTHRTNPLPMVIAFALWLIAWFVSDGVHYLHGLLVYSDLIGSRGFARLYLVPLAWFCLPECAVIVGLLLGGIAAGRPGSLSAAALRPTPPPLPRPPSSPPNALFS